MAANLGPHNSSIKRFLFSLFFASVACGTFFYLITFLGLIAELFRGPLNPATTPAFSSALNHVLLPLNLAVGAVTFFLAFLWRRISDAPWTSRKPLSTQQKRHP